tara:strand:+ start:211 stop:636 length:426 start_codon:yes stop_codon:yes gene_type:complete
MIIITSTLSIDENELHFNFIRSSGPGGQNVNKASTAVQLRFDVVNSPTLPEDVKKRLIQISGKKMTEKGILIIDSRRYRTQLRNRKDSVERLITLIKQAAQKSKPRKKTTPPFGSKEKRLKNKHHRSEIKKQRRPIDLSKE